MTGLTATPLERKFLRAIAAVNPLARPGREGWWSVNDLRGTVLFPDFLQATATSVAALGRSCARKGLARTEWIGTKGHGWAVYRITSTGRGLVADSCIGGGLDWEMTNPFRCPACRTPMPKLAVLLHAELSPAEVPAHPLPGYRAHSPEQETGT